MCEQTSTRVKPTHTNGAQKKIAVQIPAESLFRPPSLMARYTCASVLLAVFAIWGKIAFVPEAEAPGIGTPMHDFRITLALTVGYILSLPLLRYFTTEVLSKTVDVKLLLRESMIIYNCGQVLLNSWMVYRICDALLFRGHPLVGNATNVTSGATYAVWVHYCDKYLEFFDTFFMVLRGKMDQVSFLHVYHHISIAWAWWYALMAFPGGDSYFGALLNSWIHVMMYSYYALTLLRIPCPWKRYLTQAQLLQFVSVLIHTALGYMNLRHNLTWKLQGAYIVQAWEMISLLVLFLHFYRKAYSKKRKEAKVTLEPESVADTVSEQASLSSTSTNDTDQ